MELPSTRILLITICGLIVGRAILVRLQDYASQRLRQITPPMRMIDEIFINTYIEDEARNRTRNQLLMDEQNCQFRPTLFRDKEIWPLGEMIVGESLYVGEESTLFYIHNQEEILIKYQVDCEEIRMNWLHPLMRDFWYGKIAFEAGIGPEPLFLSSPVGFRTGTDKLGSMKLSREGQAECVEKGGAVRFMISGRLEGAQNLGQYVRKFPNSVVPFSLAMELGIKLIEKIENLNQVAQIVHGDIHPGNIMVDDAGRVWLIDYGRARANKPARSSRPIYDSHFWNHQAFTHWQIRGYEWAARDDVFNALRSLAWVMNDSSYDELEKDLRESFDLIPWREREYIFALPGASDAVENLPVSDEKKEQIRRSLQRILDSVRSLDHVDDVPDYDLIVKELENCFQLSQSLS